MQNFNQKEFPALLYVINTIGKLDITDLKFKESNITIRKQILSMQSLKGPENIKIYICLNSLKYIKMHEIYNIFKIETRKERRKEKRNIKQNKYESTCISYEIAGQNMLGYSTYTGVLYINFFQLS